MKEDESEILSEEKAELFNDLQTEIFEKIMNICEENKFNNQDTTLFILTFSTKLAVTCKMAVADLNCATIH